mmetsp:Transcript_103700/g.231657  ORF Transcript_103700/g.231657 Transcript_103700/m.231657 type:complete len:458 (+) Transcript_103700:90-1463(+)
MEAALRMLLQNSLGEYVSGGLDKLDATKFPLTLKELKLNEKKIQEDMDEGGTPFEFSSGTIGSISLTPGWLGVEVRATDVVLNLSFSATKAMKWAMKTEEPEDGEQEEEDIPGRPLQSAAPPPVPVAPRFCTKHDASEKRVKKQPRMQECTSCHINIQTSYADFALCPGCSEGQRRCMICAAEAPLAGSYVPAQRLEAEARAAAAMSMERRGADPENATAPLRPAQAMPPVARFCTAHDASEKRTKGSPRIQACTGCRLECQTSYVEFTLCPACSDEQQRCVNCGAGTIRTESACDGFPPGSNGAEAATPRPAGHGSELPATLATAMEAGRGVDCPGGVAGSEQDGHGDGPIDLPWPKGRWRDGSTPLEGVQRQHRQADQTGCGLPCTGDGSLMGFLKVFDVSSWTRCLAEGAAPLRNSGCLAALPRGEALQPPRCGDEGASWLPPPPPACKARGGA